MTLLRLTLVILVLMLMLKQEIWPRAELSSTIISMTATGVTQQYHGLTGTVFVSVSACNWYSRAVERRYACMLVMS